MGLTIWDLDREFFIGPLKLADSEKKFATLRQILEMLRQTYCGKVGAEYMHIQIPEQKTWLQERMEPTRNQAPLERGRAAARAGARGGSRRVRAFSAHAIHRPEAVFAGRRRIRGRHSG